MWYSNLHLYGIAALILAMIIIYQWFLSYPLDSAEARRRAYPILINSRSHPTPQVGWHPAQKITKKPDGTVDDLKIERNLKVENGYYVTRSGGLRVFWQSYRPKNLGEVTHGYVLLHGYGAHSDYTIRQRALMISQLNNAWVFTFDYPGHGRSDGLWAFISDWKLLIRQCTEIVEFEFLPKVLKLKKPMFCLGFSQGGAVGIHLCMLRPKLFRGIVLISPMCGISDELHPSPYLTKILTFISWFAGKLPIVPKKDLQKLIFKDSIVYKSLYLPRVASRSFGLYGSDQTSDGQRNFTSFFGNHQPRSNRDENTIYSFSW